MVVLHNLAIAPFKVAPSEHFFLLSLGRQKSSPRMKRLTDNAYSHDSSCLVFVSWEQSSQSLIPKGECVESLERLLLQEDLLSAPAAAGGDQSGTTSADSASFPKI